MRIQVDEEQSADTELSHAHETVGALVFECADNPPTLEPDFEFGATLTGTPTVLSGTADDDMGVMRVGVGVRNRNTGEWLQEDDSFGPAFDRFDATLSDPGGTETTWAYEAALPSGDYALSARAFDTSDNQVSISPWRHFTVVAAEPPPATGSIHGYKFEDTAGDGDPIATTTALDAVFANQFDLSTGSGQVNRVCLGDGHEGFMSCRDVSGDTNFSNGVALGLVDGDGFLDAVFANEDRNRVCLGDGTGAFTSCSDVAPDTNFSTGVALGLVDGDGFLDAVFSNFGPNRVCLGDGTGAFTCDDVSGESGETFEVALGLVDGDEFLDAVFAGFLRNRVCLGDGLGGFTCDDVSAEVEDTFGVALGLVDGDGFLDAVFADQARNRVCFGDGLGGFTCSGVSIDVISGNSNGVALGFVDGDGFLDAVFAASPQSRVCFGDGAGGFTCDDVTAEVEFSFSVALGMVDGDQFLDAMFANDFGSAGDTNRVCLGDGAGGFTCDNVSADTNASVGVALGDLGGLKPPMSGVEFTLEGTANTGDAVGPLVTTTGAAGEFWFEDLPAGTYTVTETVPAGYVSTTAASVVVTIGPGEEAVAFAGQAMLDPGQFETVNADLFFGNQSL